MRPAGIIVGQDVPDQLSADDGHPGDPGRDSHGHDRQPSADGEGGDGERKLDRWRTVRIASGEINTDQDRFSGQHGQGPVATQEHHGGGNGEQQVTHGVETTAGSEPFMINLGAAEEEHSRDHGRREDVGTQTAANRDQLPNIHQMTVSTGRSDGIRLTTY
ncbi:MULTISPECIES: hypothetical protein [Protofrankia]|uniref:Uncharacterized protein n=1 Tax=Candidatus Protofrankia datiscae TaxID=2716812 RepID=F8B1C6_9ACTN|nr:MULTISPECIES: hypothetical protein [Protofrankia]AEH09795.1 hypothetical protein FsymDg_2416 [Candidatus Protofrankia datiscae]